MGFRDRRKAGGRSLVRFIPGEDSGARHYRRLATNLEHQDSAEAMAESRGLVLKILNDGHHWKITAPGFLAEWWPSSAKLIFNQRWHHGVHAHDFHQVFREIDNERGKA